MGRYDKFTTGLSSAPVTGSAPGSGKYDKYLTGLPTDNRRLDQKIAEPIEAALRFINNPGGAPDANVMAPRGDELFEKWGTRATEALGRRGVNPVAAAIPGMAVTMMNPENWITPKIAPTAIMRPTVPAARQLAVEGAREMKIPLSRAQQTGSPFLEGSEALLEKTPLGRGPIAKARAETATAADAALKKVSKEIGTSDDLYASGQKSQSEMAPRREAMNMKRQEMFDAVPDEINIPLNKSVSTADQIMAEQSKFLPTTRNSDVMAIAQDIQKAHKGTSAGEGVTGGPEVRGVTTQTPETLIKGKKVVTEHPVEPPPNQPYHKDPAGGDISQEGGGPSHYTVDQTPDRVIPGKNVYGAEYSVGPEQAPAPKSNFQLMKRLRETLGGKIEEAKLAKNYTAMRDYTRLKASVDSDIDSFVSSQSSPVESLMADEFKKTYKQANAFSGAYKNLFDSKGAKALSEAPPERVVDMVFKKNNETGIKQFRALVGEEGFKPAKSRFTQNLLESKNIKSELAKYEEGTLNAIYTPVELHKLTKLGETMDLLGSVERGSGNPSGTARQIIGGGSWGAAASALFAGHPVVAASILGLPYVASKALVGMANGIPISSAIQKAALSAKGAAGNR